MIDHSEIEAELGVVTLMTDVMQAAIEDWYNAAINGWPLNKDPDTLSCGWPAAICDEEARLTMLELEAKVEGSPRADWINGILQKQVLAPRRRRKLSLALALGSGVWKPYQAGRRIAVDFVPATGYYPVSFSPDGEPTEAVFVNQIRDRENYYNHVEWMHCLTERGDITEDERELLKELGASTPREFPCVQVINLAYMSSSKDSLGARVELDVRPEWEDVEPVAYLPGLEKLPVGYFVTPLANRIEPSSELGMAMFAPATQQIIDADIQYTRLDWEYEGGELAVDIDQQYLKPQGAPDGVPDALSRRIFGVPSAALTRAAPKHRERLFQGIDVNTGITQSAPFYQVFAPALRDGAYMSGLNLYIRNIESHAGLSYGTFSQVAETEKTATEIMNSKQKLYSTIADLQAAMQDTLEELVDALNFWADQIDDAPEAGEIRQSYHWDDSIIIDRMTEMAQWQQEVSLGLRSRTEYRQHFYGEDEQTAAQAIAAITQEGMAAEMLQGVLSNGSQDAKQGQQKGKSGTGK